MAACTHCSTARSNADGVCSSLNIVANPSTKRDIGDVPGAGRARKALFQLALPGLDRAVLVLDRQMHCWCQSALDWRKDLDLKWSRPEREVLIEALQAIQKAPHRVVDSHCGRRRKRRIGVEIDPQVEQPGHQGKLPIEALER